MKKKAERNLTIAICFVVIAIIFSGAIYYFHFVIGPDATVTLVTIVSNPNAGIITLSPMLINDGAYQRGTVLTATFTFNQGWAGGVLNHWEINGVNVGSANPIQFTINSNTNLVAVLGPLGAP